MIYLLHLKYGWNNIYLFRESTLNYRINTMIDLKMLERAIQSLYPSTVAPVNDFVALIFLIGNDFLPHFPSFERVHDGLNTLVAGYAVFLGQNPGKGLTTGSNIDWNNFGLFLKFISYNYTNILLEKWGKNDDAKIKFPSAVAEQCIIQASKIIGTQKQCVKEMDVDKFKGLWYKYIFSPKTGQGVIEPSQTDKDTLISNYLSGITWVYNYYRLGKKAIDVSWFYPYHYSPLFSDLGTYVLDSIESGKGTPWELTSTQFHSNFPTPLEQLVMVLPPLSILAVPEPIRTLYTEYSSIRDMLPSSFLVDPQGKMEKWEEIAILPFPIPIRVTRAILQLNLPEDYTKYFEPQKPLEITRNLGKAFRIAAMTTRGRGQEHRGRGQEHRGRGQEYRGRGRGRGQEHRGGFQKGKRIFQTSRPRGEQGTRRGSNIPLQSITGSVEYRNTFK